MGREESIALGSLAHSSHKACYRPATCCRRGQFMPRYGTYRTTKRTLHFPPATAHISFIDQGALHNRDRARGSENAEIPRGPFSAGTRIRSHSLSGSCSHPFWSLDRHFAHKDQYPKPSVQRRNWIRKKKTPKKRRRLDLLRS